MSRPHPDPARRLLKALGRLRRLRSTRALSCVVTTLAIVAITGWWQPVTAQFGQNKVQYRSFDWRILSTEHFDVYFYSDERAAAKEAARMAERGYSYLSEFFDHEFDKKIPLVLYSSHQDFEQSNIIGGFIGEGTGGVTESLKGRVTLPLTGSYFELNHVLVHELVHAFQFDMMRRNFIGQIGGMNMPLWMIEGMAEWVSNGMDPITSMWIMDAKLEDKVPTIGEMSRVQDIRVYRMGQAIYEVIGKNFGHERVRRMLKRPNSRNRSSQPDSSYVPLPPPPAAAETEIHAAPSPEHFGRETSDRKSLEELWAAYSDSLSTLLSDGLVHPDSVAEVVATGNRYGGVYHLAPVISPDGDKILYYSSRGFSNELFMTQKENGKWRKHSLVQGETTPELESLPLLSASADWSPSGRDIVFVSTQQGQDVLQIFDTRKGRIKKTIKTELLALSNPSYSPDGQYVVFSALQGGEEDLFAVELGSERLVRLTQDAYSERTPRFNPQGDALIFATDRGPETDLDDLVFGPWNIGRMRLRFDDGGRLMGGSVDLVIDAGSNEFSPVWSPDGSMVAYISDRTGTHQVHSYEFATGEVRQRTRFLSGVVGIVQTAPAFHWGQDNQVVYSVFRRAGWHLYRTQGFPENTPGDLDAERMQITRGQPNEVQEDASRRLNTTERDYKARLTLEAATVGALYVGNSGAGGAGALLLGDMLGNQYVYVAGNLRSEINLSELLIQYANIGHRWQWGISAYQFRDYYLAFTSENEADFENSVRRGIGTQLHYPFNRFRRIEFNLDLITIGRETQELLFEQSSIIEQGSDKSRYYYAQPGVALVQDNAGYAFFTPVRGGRWRFEYAHGFGDLQYHFEIFDFRRYFNIKRRGALAWRLLTAGTGGKDPLRLTIGGPDTFRGSDFGEFEGTRVALMNTEFRFPIFPSTDLIRGVAFFDAATTWGQGVFRRGVQVGDGELAIGDLTSDELYTAVGFGVRGFIGVPLRFDVALPTSKSSNHKWRSYFSIGFDY